MAHERLSAGLNNIGYPFMRFAPPIFRRFGKVLSSRHEPEGVRTLANLYWRTLLLVAFVAVILVFVYGIWGLLRVLDDLGAMVKVSAPPAPVLNRDVLDVTVEGINARRAQFEL